MEKIEIPIIVQDPETWLSSTMKKRELRPIEGAEFERCYFGDGPRTDSVVMIGAGKAKYLPAKNKIGGYGWPDGKNILNAVNAAIRDDDHKEIKNILYSPEFIQVSTFACILRTIDLFEEKLLGRPWTWAFSNELTCRPCKQEDDPNGGYQRENETIFLTRTEQSGKSDLYSCLSREFVAHEAAHAIIDGINPHLYYSSIDQAKALHESLADLTALFITVKSHTLMDYVMQQSDGSLKGEEGDNLFSKFAENLGRVTSGGRRDILRNFKNKMKLSEAKDYYQGSTVLSGAIWDIICQLHEPIRKHLAETKFKKYPNPEYSASGMPLKMLAERLQPVLFRALDILPGGDITLADYGRAILLADQVQFGSDTQIAKTLIQEFNKREIFNEAHNEAQVECPPLGIPSPPMGGWIKLLDDKRAARNFANKEHVWLGIPAKIGKGKLEIESQSCITALPFKKYLHMNKKHFRNGPIGILRIMWPVISKNIFVRFLEVIGLKRPLTAGTSIIIDKTQNCILARLSNVHAT